MFKTSLLLVAIASLAGSSQLKAVQPPAEASAEIQATRPGDGTTLVVEDTTELFRSVHIVMDLAEFNIGNLRPQKTGAWIVAKIQPGGMSGTLHNQGSYIQAETGKVIDSGVRPKLVLLVGGQWKRIELLSGNAPQKGRFQWKEPYVEHSFDRHFNIYDNYSVFTGPKNDGTVVCQFFKNRGGAEQFSSVTAIPDDWKTFLKPAYEYHVQHSTVFADTDLAGLRKMASGDNPFIALTAIRHLLSNTTTAEEIEQLVDLAPSLSKYRQAVLILWLLKRNDDNSRDIVLQAIRSSKKIVELTGMALGIEIWAASKVREITDRKPDLNLHDIVVEKWQTLDPSALIDHKSWTKLLVAPGCSESQYDPP